MTQAKTQAPFYTLNDDDIQYIEEMAAFFGITRDEAYERFCNGNIDGLNFEEEDTEAAEE